MSSEKLAILTQHKTSEEFPIYIGDTVRDKYTKGEGLVTHHCFVHGGMDQVRYILSNYDDDEVLSNSAWSDISDVVLVSKGDRPDLPEPEFANGDIVLDKISGKEVIVKEVTFTRNNDPIYLVMRTGVDPDGNRFNTYDEKGINLEVIEKPKPVKQDKVSDVTKPGGPTRGVESTLDKGM